MGRGKSPQSFDLEDIERIGLGADIELLLTPVEWCEMEGIIILDADGWNGPGAPSWQTPIPKKEFERRRDVSTIGPATKKVEKINPDFDISLLDPLLQEAAELYKQGIGFVEIGKKLNRHPSVIRLRLVERGFINLVTVKI
jgi:hypothetical protein